VKISKESILTGFRAIGSNPSQVTRESKTHLIGGFFILEEIQARLRFQEKYKTASACLRGFAF